MHELLPGKCEECYQRHLPEDHGQLGAKLCSVCCRLPSPQPQQKHVAQLCRAYLLAERVLAA